MNKIKILVDHRSSHIDTHKSKISFLIVPYFMVNLVLFE